MTISQQLDEFSPDVLYHSAGDYVNKGQYDKLLSIAKLLAKACEDMSKSASISSRLTSSEALTEAQKILGDTN